MAKQIKRRLLKGWKPTKKQIEFIKEYIDPKYDNSCGHCYFNLNAYFGTLPEEFSK